MHVHYNVRVYQHTLSEFFRIHWRTWTKTVLAFVVDSDERDNQRKNSLSPPTSIFRSGECDVSCRLCVVHIACISTNVWSIWNQKFRFIVKLALVDWFTQSEAAFFLEDIGFYYRASFISCDIIYGKCTRARSLGLRCKLFISLLYALSRRFVSQSARPYGLNGRE